MLDHENTMYIDLFYYRHFANSQYRSGPVMLYVMRDLSDTLYAGELVCLIWVLVFVCAPILLKYLILSKREIYCVIHNITHVSGSVKKIPHDIYLTKGH